VTDRKEAERALRESEADYRSLFENSIMGIYRSTPDGRFVTVNQAFTRIFGYASPEEILHSVADIGNQMYANPEDRSRILAMLEVEQRAVVETCIRRRDGTIGRILNNVRIVRNDDGGILYYEGFIQDITDLKRAEEELQKTLLELESRVHERTLDLKEANTALRVLISRRAEDQRQLEERLQMNVNDLILPVLEEIKSVCLDKRSAGYLSLLESNLKDITSPFLKGLQATYRNLTAREIQVAAMIRDGKKTKEISELLEVSPVTVETHRNHIRTKLGLVRGKTNLRSYLLSIK
jgi:PAS domain S-box-containing protein